MSAGQRHFLLGCALLACVVRFGSGQFSGSCDSQPSLCSCVYTDIGTQQKMIVDLESLSNTDGSFRYSEVRGEDQFLYFYNPCQPATISAGCTDVIGCQLWEGIFSGLGTLQTSRFINTGTSMGIQSQATSEGIPRILRVNLLCREDISPAVLAPVGDSAVQYTYVYNLNGKEACPQPYGTSGGGTIELTVDVTPGTWMCIVALTLIVCYMVGGILIQHFRFQKTGKEMLPNYTFWVAFPGLVKEGAMFLVSKVRREDSSPTYEKL